MFRFRNHRCLGSMLSRRHIELVKSTVPLLEGAGPAVTDHFYQRLFRDNPEVLNIFNLSNQASGRQQFALFSAIAAYAKHLDNPEVLTAAVERINQKHSSLNILSEHYPIVGHHLLETLRELVPDQFTPEIEEAWGLAYQQLAEIFIQREKAIYERNANMEGGWQGGREFLLAEAIQESEFVKSLVFAPADEGKVATFKPGQYIGIELEIPGRQYKDRRQYSISSRPNNERYRISVRRENRGERAGVVSNYLHDSLKQGDRVTLYPPAGDFFLKEAETPVVLISAGVGITPMQCILETLAHQKSQRRVFYLHACENPVQHSFTDATEASVKHLNLSIYTWYTTGVSSLKNFSDNVFDGRMNLSDLKGLPIKDGDFYLCGPTGFMSALKSQLLALQVDASQIHYEVFGPHEDL